MQRRQFAAGRRRRRRRANRQFRCSSRSEKRFLATGRRSLHWQWHARSLTALIFDFAATMFRRLSRLPSSPTSSSSFPSLFLFSSLFPFGDGDGRGMDVSVASKERFIHHLIAAVTISCRPLSLSLSPPAGCSERNFDYYFLNMVPQFPFGLVICITFTEELDLI